MKNKSILILLPMLAVLLAACGAGGGTELPVQPTNTEAAVVEEAPIEEPSEWQRVQEAGVIEFGTSADYPPFEYYDESYEIIGFDAALARELGSRLSLDVELVDIPFEGLPAALQAGQIDAAIAAISVSPERDAMMDFTNVYYSSQDMILALEESEVEAIVEPEQLASYRIGVQRGSIFASWAQDTLIATGLMSESNLFQYERSPEAIRDLRDGQIDLVILDKLAAEKHILAGGIFSAGQNLNTELYAIALPEGASELQAELNMALTEVMNDGTIARLADTYLDIQLPEVMPTPAPTPTAIPGPTATPASCFNSMEYVRDVKVPDGTEMRPGQDFDKVWRLRNTGTCTWEEDYRLVFVQGDRMEGTPGRVRDEVAPGDTYDMIVDQEAPSRPGKYTGIWQMVDDDDNPFGERIWVKIRVPDDEGNAEPQPTAAPPTATPQADQPTPVQPTLAPEPTEPPIPVQPTLVPEPVITELFVSSENVQQGELVVVNWAFSGEGLASATITRTNPDGSETPLFGGADVDPQGQYEDLMMEVGQYTYTLRVSSEFGGTAVQSISVNVNEE